MVSVDAQKLRELVQKIFVGNGLTEADAEIMANVLVETNLSGRASHGVLRVVAYLDRLNKGGAKRQPNIHAIHETPISAVIDGDNGLGMLVAYKAAEITRKKAEESGFACVVVKNSNHFGANANWNEMIGRDDMITFSCCNTSPLMAPPGGKEAALGTNPLCIYVPSASHGPLCMDIATSMVAQGKLFDYRLKHLPIPDGWAVDKDGKNTNDANAAEFLVPFGAHKGYGFAVMVDVMSALLAGGQFGKDVNNMYDDIEKPNYVSHCFMAMKIDHFRDPEEFRKDVDRYIDYLHSTPAAEGQRVYVPGEIEQINKEKCLAEGLQLPEDLVKQLIGFGKDVGIADAEEYFK